MKTEIIPSNSPSLKSEALSVLRAGGLVAFPTDTVYGLGCLAFDGNAVESIYVAKDRPIEKAIPVLVGEIMDTEKIVTEFPPIPRILALRFWPGPLTCILPKKPTLPEAVSATSTIGVRIPDEVTARVLLRNAGPMVVTSANISGQPSPSTAEEVFEQLNGRIPLIIDGGKTPGGVPSTVVDCLSEKFVILREGPISADDIQNYLQNPR
jgi:L-threonylcarbamoyladenylate synthase